MIGLFYQWRTPVLIASLVVPLLAVPVVCSASPRDRSVRVPIVVAELSEENLPAKELPSPTPSSGGSSPQPSNAANPSSDSNVWQRIQNENVAAPEADESGAASPA